MRRKVLGVFVQFSFYYFLNIFLTQNLTGFNRCWQNYLSCHVFSCGGQNLICPKIKIDKYTLMEYTFFKFVNWNSSVNIVTNLGWMTRV
jgi:hypothetical protein